MYRRSVAGCIACNDAISEKSMSLITMDDGRRVTMRCERQIEAEGRWHLGWRCKSDRLCNEDGHQARGKRRWRVPSVGDPLKALAPLCYGLGRNLDRGAEEKTWCPRLR